MIRMPFSFRASSPPASGTQTPGGNGGAPLQKAASEPVTSTEKAQVKSPGGGSGLRSRLYKMIGRSDKARRKSTGGAPPGPASASAGIHDTGHLRKALAAGDHSQEIVGKAGAKLARDRDRIGTILNEWAGDKSGATTLHGQTRKFIDPGTNKDKIDGLGPDSLRSAVTALRAIKGSDASEALKQRAELIGRTPVFRTISYINDERQVRPFTVDQFGTHDTYKYIDQLRLPPDERKAIADRFRAALDDIHELNRSYLHAHHEAPSPKLDPFAVIDIHVDHPARTAPAPALPAQNAGMNAGMKTQAQNTQDVDTLLHALAKTRDTAGQVKIIRALRTLGQGNPALNRRLDEITNGMMERLRSELRDENDDQIKALLRRDIAEVGSVRQQQPLAPSPRPG